MELLLTNAAYKQHYACFLIDNDINLPVPDHLIIPFMNYLQEQYKLLTSETVVEPETTEPLPTTRARWSESDVSKLSSLLAQDLSLSQIAYVLGRTEDSIRKYARTHFNLVYRKNKWIDLTYPGSSAT
jgi:CO dehydrogenase nickel-insertion accessory protein CooC1